MSYSIILFSSNIETWSSCFQPCKTLLETQHWWILASILNLFMMFLLFFVFCQCFRVSVLFAKRLQNGCRVCAAAAQTRLCLRLRCFAAPAQTGAVLQHICKLFAKYVWTSVSQTTRASPSRLTEMYRVGWSDKINMTGCFPGLLRIFAQTLVSESAMWLVYSRSDCLVWLEQHLHQLTCQATLHTSTRTLQCCDCKILTLQY